MSKTPTSATGPPRGENSQRVAGVFDSVATRYDLMNDLMSAGRPGCEAFRDRGERRASGRTRARYRRRPGDLAQLYARRVGARGEVVLTDVNSAMLRHGRDRLLDAGMVVPVAQCDAEKLPFAAERFDCVSVAFGLRNMTHKETALAEMRRVLKPGGRLLVLEFSRVWAPLKPLYDAYSFGLLPRLGKLVTNDANAYRYLAESIRMHPDQEALKMMMEQAGLERVEYFNLAAGVVALHRGYKF